MAEGRRVTDARGAAEILGISTSWLRRLCIAGRIHGAFKVGASWYVPLPVRRLPASQPRREVPPGTANRLEAAGVRFTRSRAFIEALEAGTPDDVLRSRYRSSYPRRYELAAREARIRRRNMEILRAAEQRERRHDIATRHQVSAARVTQIIREMLDLAEHLGDDPG